MTLLVYEHLTSGALCGQLFPAGLMQEGDAMLSAIVQDLLQLGHQLVLLRDGRLPAPDVAADGRQLQIRWIHSPQQFAEVWTECLQQHDDFLVIAPETGATLLSLAQQLELQQKHFLGCTADTIALCSDKLRCCQHLQQHQLSTPDTLAADDWLQHTPATGRQWVIKPIDGAGCEHTYVLDTRQARRMLSGLPADQRRETIVQPYIDGTALSLNLFVSNDGIELLSVNHQIIAQEQQQLRLVRCEVNSDALLDRERAMALARQLHATMPGLWGFVGIDLIRRDDELWLVDINPRLTSSYAESGMRLQRNPALALHHQLSKGKS